MASSGLVPRGSLILNEASTASSRRYTTRTHSTQYTHAPLAAALTAAALGLAAAAVASSTLGLATAALDSALTAATAAPALVTAARPWPMEARTT